MENKYNLTDVTPKEYLCAAAACPTIYEGIREKTPKEYPCAAGACSSIHEAKKQEEIYLIIGKTINPKDAGLEKKVGQNESLIEVPKGLIDDIRE